VSSSSAVSAEVIRSRAAEEAPDVRRGAGAASMKVVLLTGGKDGHYARGLTRALTANGMRIELVGGREEMLGPGDVRGGSVALHDFVGKQDPHASQIMKIARVCAYFVRLFVFAAVTDARLFHILWFRRFARLERILVVAYLRLLRKKVVFTAHNVDDRARDGAKTHLADRLSLRFLYRAADHLLVHTGAMKEELTSAFDIAPSKVTVVPLGINDVVPAALVTHAEARQQLAVRLDARVLLFFGNIAPYKGVEDLIRALAELVPDDDRFIAIIAGPIRNRGAEAYYRDIERLIIDLGLAKHVMKETRHIPDEQAGLFFKAADVSILPYRRVYQSGVLGLSYAQGLPVIAADVGAMRDDIVDGETGLLFRPGDAGDLAAKIRSFFASSMYRDRDVRERMIAAHGATRFSWSENAERTVSVYAQLLRPREARR
jgi:glycosyltransferase involved in cell wall biosynthesis